MSVINNQFLSAVDANTDGKIFDYAHASQLFVADNYKLSPKYSFLYYVRFETDPLLTDIPSTSALIETGQLVKSVSLPKFTVETKNLNAYNRTNISQTKIKYDPVTITFHDDGNNTVLDFWRDYYDYYYRDGDYQNKDSDTSTANYLRDHKYQFNGSDPQNTWGYTLRNNGWKQQFLDNIRLYSLNRGTFTEYILINPMITSFQHGQHTAGENSTLTHTMTVAYETVLYYRGYVTDSNITGMLDLHYDKRPSSLTPFGLNGTGTGGFNRPRVFGARGVFGNGGILDTTDQIIGDIGGGNLGGAFVKGFKAYQNNKGANLKDIATMEAKRSLIKGILTGTNPFSGVNIPVISNLARGVGGAVQDGADWASEKFGVKQSSQNAAASRMGAGYAAAGAAGVSYEAKQKLNQDTTTSSRGVVSNGSSVARPGQDVFNSPGFNMPKDTSSDISNDSGSNNPVINTSRPGPNNSDSGAGSDWEPKTGGTGSNSYTPFYARPMNNPPQDQSGNQGRVKPENGFSGDGSGGVMI
jgi:hypothetical protein